MVFFFRSKDNKNLPTSLLAERAELLKLFKSCDVNNDGKLSKDEVKAAFRKLQSRCPAYRTLRAFKVADEDGDGYISKEELDELINYALKCYEGDVKLRLT